MKREIEDFMVGQESVLRALEVAVAGQHSLCIITEDPERFVWSTEFLSEARIAVVTPCPCGFLGHPLRACHCSKEEIAQHQKAWFLIAGRIAYDMYVSANPGRIEDLLKAEKPPLHKEAKELLAVGFEKLGLTYSEGKKILQVAKTIAELERRTAIAAQHLAEAMQYGRSGL